MAGASNLLEADAAACRRALAQNRTVLVDFWGPWCGPCKAVSPMVAKIAEDHPWLAVVKVDIERNGELADQFEVQSIPALLLFQDGHCVDRLIGKVPYIALRRMVEKHGPA